EEELRLFEKRKSHSGRRTRGPRLGSGDDARGRRGLCRNSSRADCPPSVAFLSDCSAETSIRALVRYTFPVLPLPGRVAAARRSGQRHSSAVLAPAVRGFDAPLHSAWRGWFVGDVERQAIAAMSVVAGASD